MESIALDLIMLVTGPVRSKLIADPYTYQQGLDALCSCIRQFDLILVTNISDQSSKHTCLLCAQVLHCTFVMVRALKTSITGIAQAILALPRV